MRSCIMGGHNGTTAYRQQAMTDAERQCRRRQRLAAEGRADEVERIKLRLKSKAAIRSTCKILPQRWTVAGDQTRIGATG